ncbi:MAG: serine/threonine protein kinase [Planctomycetes bacterium]|nr:serine/threonine protein kinase [Planctomycetota bacterium]
MSERTEQEAPTGDAELGSSSKKRTLVDGVAKAVQTIVDPVGKFVPHRFQPGDTFGDYVILRELGHGGFATVYLVHDVSLNRRIALKVSERGGLGEGKTLAELEHAHIVQVHAQFTDAVSGKHCLCLQYVPGTTLKRVIEHLHREGQQPRDGRDILDAIVVASNEEVPFDLAGVRNREILSRSDFASAVCRIGRQLAEALDFAHRRGILHCDIKPANVLINPYGRPLLADFNVSVDFDPSRPAKSTGGTIAYMAPEQLANLLNEPGQSINERSDIYALGTLLFEFMTGHRPFPESTTPETLLRTQRMFDFHVSWANEKIPPVLERILRRCLEPSPELRYANASELANALTNAFDLLTIENSLPQGTRMTAWAMKWPVFMLIALTMLPQLLSSAFNIAYNAIEIRLAEDQRTLFVRLVLVYNLVAYPIAIFVTLRLLVPLMRGWHSIGLSGAIKSTEVEALRKLSLRVAHWGMILALLGWLPGGLIFPFMLDFLTGPVPSEVYAHFLLSFTLSGLIALIYSHFAIQFIVLRIIYPRLGDADTYTRDGARQELSHSSRFLVPFQSLAAVIPLVGAALLVLVEREMTLLFRLLVTSLIVLGMIGVGIAVSATRRLSQIVRLLEGDSAQAAARISPIEQP